MRSIFYLLVLCCCARPIDLASPPELNSALIPTAQSLAASTPASQKQRWHWENPLPQGNSIFSFWHDTGLLLGVGDGGSVIRSTDEKNFEVIPIDTTGVLLSIHGDKTNIFIGGQDGIWRSNDQGKTWEHLKLSANIRAIQVTSTAVYALEINSTIHVSLDKGDSWKSVTVAKDAALSSIWADDDVLLVAPAEQSIQTSTSYGFGFIDPKTLKGGVIWRSLDQGKTWYSVSFSNYHTHPSRFVRLLDGTLLGVGHGRSDSHSEMVCNSCIDAHAESFGVFKSTDQGATWSKLRDEVSSSLGSNLRGVWESHPNIEIDAKGKLYLLHNNTLQTSSDQGNNWENREVPRTGAVFIWLDPRGNLFASDFEGRVYRYEKKEWSPVGEEPLGVSIVRTLLLPSGEILGVGSKEYRGAIAKRTPTGNWSEVKISKKVGVLQSIAQNGDTILVAGAQGALLRSTDGGKSFEVLPERQAGRVLFQGTYWYLFGERGVLYRSKDSEAWETVRPATDGKLAKQLLFQTNDEMTMLGIDTRSGPSLPWGVQTIDGKSWTEIKDLPEVMAAEYLWASDGSLWLWGQEKTARATSFVLPQRVLYLMAPGSTSWKKIEVPVQSLFYALQEDSTGKLWALGVGIGRASSYSKDQGKTWTETRLPIYPSFFQELKDGSRLWINGTLIVRE